ncbi:MAG: outer membrane beta-barrel protein, partial [Thalassospira sp.]|nr:outer membrane beta-barrel protein [Thalassospira sp.]
IDITTGQYISGGFSFQRLHEERGFPNTANVVSNLGPTLYNVSAANIGYTRKVGQIGLSVAYDAVDYNYLDNENVRNDDRDRFDNIGTARVGYEFMRGYEVFARGSLSDRQYADFRDDNGFARGGEGYEAVLGADFRLTGTLSGDVYAGQASKSFDDIRFRDVDSFVYGSSLLWFPTQLTSIKFQVDRSIEDAVLSGASSYIQSDHFIRVEHELQRNFLVSANAGYSEFDFQGGVDREDKIYNAGVGGKYLVSRNVYIGGDYQLRQRNSDATFSDYQQQVVMATIGLRY